MKIILSAIFSFALISSAYAQTSDVSSQTIYIDPKGVMRWKSNKEEVRLFGANYGVFSGGDYRMAELVGADHKALIDADMAHFARMGWDGLRLCFYGDWENSDHEGNLVENHHLELMDYTVSRAAERGIHMLLSPIVNYSSGFADKMGDPTYKPIGFSAAFTRPTMGTDPKAIAAQSNYLRQLLNHVNPFTKRAIKDEPNIPFVEMINEPVHTPENFEHSVNYINTLVDAVRSTGSKQITFHNFSQDFKIVDALATSKAQGASFAWYNSGLNSGANLEGNFLPGVDHYPNLLDTKIANRPRLVYEFDQADLNTGYLFPAMVRTYREVGTQFAAIFAYDMLETAPYNLGWQTHFINLVHTPRQAVSSVISAEAMRRLPRLKNYGNYPDNTHFGDFRVDYETDSSVLNSSEAYMNAGDTRVVPQKPKNLSRIVGIGTSPIVHYEGTGAYFLDKVRDGIWRLELYPDQILASDPFAQADLANDASRLYFKSWPMTINLPDLGSQFTATPLVLPAGSKGNSHKAQHGMVTASPGVWLLSKKTNVDAKELPETINRVKFKEYHVNAPKIYPDLIQSLTSEEFLEGSPAQIKVRLLSQSTPETLSLYVRSVGGGFNKPIELKHLRGYDYGAILDAKELPLGEYEYLVSFTDKGQTLSFPGGVKGKPWVWPSASKNLWRFSVVQPNVALELFNPKLDFAKLAYVRLREGERTEFQKLVVGESSNQNALSLKIQPLNNGDMPEHYAGGFFIGDKLSPRAGIAHQAKSVEVRARTTSGSRKTLDLFLIEKDGSSWRGRIVVGPDWSTQSIPLESFTFSRSLIIPTPYPGLWNYWREGPKSRISSKIQIANVERLELRIYPNVGETSNDDSRSIEVESVRLKF